MYIQQEQRKLADESVAGVNSVESLAYEITVFILAMWNTNPVDETIAVVTKELVVDPKSSKLLNTLRSSLAHSFTVAEIHTAARLAYDEFYQRIIRLHRAVQCRENGDIEGYQVAMKPLLDKLGSEIKKEVSSQLIIPTGVK